ncbi:hypothetical protein PV458_09540 [Streptomyces sp. MN03-5084-2B]|nr:hypothetical protein [Streptomyces sp. MN03-5084-2B]
MPFQMSACKDPGAHWWSGPKNHSPVSLVEVARCSSSARAFSLIRFWNSALDSVARRMSKRSPWEA